MAKYIKCPRCELNYILEGEDYCYVCKSEMKHHTEADEDDLLDIEDMELCPMCGQNYIAEDQTMCDECKGKSRAEGGEAGKDWKGALAKQESVTQCGACHSKGKMSDIVKGNMDCTPCHSGNEHLGNKFVNHP